jgi:hypothetical protein
VIDKTQMNVDGVRTHYQTLQHKNISQTFVGFAEKIVAYFGGGGGECVHVCVTGDLLIKSKSSAEFADQACCQLVCRRF